MRHLTLLLCLAGLCCHLCLTAQQPVKVNGIVKGIGSGRLLMIVPVNETQTDTIATTDFKESSEFTLEGMVKEPTGVQIILENYSGGFFFFVTAFLMAISINRLIGFVNGWFHGGRAKSAA